MPIPDSLLLQTDALVCGYQHAITPPISLTLQRGEVVGLAGPNGVGKSTFLSGLYGGARVFAGAVRQAEEALISHQTQRFDNFAGLPVTGQDLLGLTGATHAGLPPWLTDKLTQRLDRLSGGQLQFLRLWAILASPGDIVLLDEPTNNLDAPGVAALTRLLQQPDPQRGYLVVSHDSDFLHSIATRIVHVSPAEVA